MDNKKSILVVDDDAAFRKTLSQIFIKKGYSVTEAESGMRALELAREKDFGVILMDIRMPIMNGVEALKKIRQIRPETNIIMMSAFALEELMADAVREGAYAILHKPFDIDAVVKLIEGEKSGAYLAVVDDDPGFIETMKMTLEKKGHKVATASSGKECIELAKASPADIYFIDIKMPVLNGVETYLELKKIKPDVIAIMMTAYRSETEELVKQALDVGVYCCIFKPFEMDKLLKIVEEIIKKK